jgi:hypothetical protein
MESGYHIVTVRVIWTFWAYVRKLRSLFLGTGYDIVDVIVDIGVVVPSVGQLEDRGVHEMWNKKEKIATQEEWSETTREN